MITIATHDSGFHTDDVFAVATLLLHVGEAKIVRSRKPEDHALADYVVDTGMQYDPARKLFDHHQKEGAGVRENGIPYASFGLVWKEYGEKIAGGKREADRLDQKLVQAIDAIDNGTSIAEYKFKNVREYALGDLFRSYLPLNPSPEEVDQTFIKLTNLAKEILVREINVAIEVVKGEDLIKGIYEKTNDKRLIELPKDEKALPWKRILSEYSEPIYVIYPRSDGSWGLRGVPNPEKPGSFVYRKDLPLGWAGKSDRELQEITGVRDAIFAHRTGFMAAANSREGVLKLAEIALNA